ncbi:MFS transporter [Brevibacillus borstelensis]|uniref:MFS transporter n=1 Tax=Brevibacillus borstelensis TaxID=45462 RepID=UPI0030C0B969
MSTIVIVVFWTLVPSKQAESNGQTEVALSIADRRIRLYVGVGLVLSSVMIILQVTCGISIQDQLSVSARKVAQLVGILLSVAGLIVVGVQLLVGRFLKWEPGRLLIIGLLSLCCAFSLFLASPQMYVIVFLLCGIGIGFTLSGYITAASLAVSEREQPAVAAYTAAVQGVGSFVGPLAGSLLYSLHVSIPYAVCAGPVAVFFVLAAAKATKGALQKAREKTV